MNAMRAATLPDEYAENEARSRPQLRVVNGAEGLVTSPSAPASRMRPAPPAATIPAANPSAAEHPAASQRAACLPAASQQVTSQAAARQVSAPLRLTRRGRVVVAVLAVVLLAALSLLVTSAALATSHGTPQGSGPSRFIVQPGQSLWSVAESADPDADTRQVVRQIIQMNSLQGDTLFAGQQLWVPRG